jgi:hypothetical protein
VTPPAPGPAGSAARERAHAPDRPRVPAVGGERLVPEPDDVARDYLLLALRLDQHAPGLVDGYFGPAHLKAQVDMEQLRSPARLADDAVALRSRLAGEVPAADRRAWLDAQLVALETQARALAGDHLPYLEHVTRCFTWTPERRSDARFDAAARGLDRLLPGDGPLPERLAAHDAAWTVPVDRLEAIVDVLVGRFRDRAGAHWELPAGSDLRVSLVRDQPWSGYNWYDGGYRSRVDLNTDLPIRLPALARTVAHETYPGHHLEHARKEAILVERQGRLEASVLLINTPECLVSEGLANVGFDLVVPHDERAPLYAELAALAGVPVAADEAGLGEAAARAVAVADLRGILDEARLNAALLLHADGRSRDEVHAYLVEVGRFAPEVATKRLEFIEHPRWRTYVFVYAEGEALLRRWLEVAPPGERPARFGRLLDEQLTPPAIAAELDAAIDAVGGPLD